ncbi:MAG TPA: hypothetical protein VFE51_21430 [Verrucomicrobiae bacterium]|nr:hypothetical protein [Verrucomicrobiae bacterium]
MKTLNDSLSSVGLKSKLSGYLAATATVAVLTMAASGAFSRVKADSHDDSRDSGRREAEWLLATHQEAQIAELDQLLADFHGALSYGGNITAMMALWAPNSSLTFNGTVNSGNTAIQSFFTGGGYFHNNWASLAPEFKTQVTLHGDMAELSTQCVAVDLGVTPNVVRAVIQVNATAVKQGGKWLFTSMNNTSPAPL